MVVEKLHEKGYGPFTPRHPLDQARTLMKIDQSRPQWDHSFSLFQTKATHCKEVISISLAKETLNLAVFLHKKRQFSSEKEEKMKIELKKSITQEKKRRVMMREEFLLLLLLQGQNVLLFFSQQHTFLKAVEIVPINWRLSRSEQRPYHQEGPRFCKWPCSQMHKNV